MIQGFVMISYKEGKKSKVTMVNVFLLQAPKPYPSEKYLHTITALFQIFVFAN